MNNLFSDITKSYLDICSTMKLLSNDSFDQDIFLEHNINQVAASMNDLIIKLQSLKFSIDGVLDINTLESQNTTENTKEYYQEQISQEQKPMIPELPNKDFNKLLNKTMKDMMPLFMMHLMSHDKDSILNKTHLPSPSQLPSHLPSPSQLTNTDPYDVD